MPEVRRRPAFARQACLGAALLTMTTHAVFGQAPAEPANQRDKAVRLVVGYGTGGGYDAYARMIAPYLAKSLAATVVVENLPGAGGIAATNRTWSAPADGLMIQLANGTGAALSQLLEFSSVRYDVLRLTHLGTVSTSPWMWMVGPKSGIRTPADAQKAGAKLSWAGSGPIDGLADGAAFICEALRLDCRVVIGYKGSSDASLAVIRGEMDAIYISDSSAISVANSGGAHAVAAISRTRSRFFPQAPAIFEAVKLDAEQTWLLDIRTAVDDLGRILVAPPGMSPDRAEFLRTAIRRTLSDPALIAEGERTQRQVSYLDTATTITNVRKVLDMPTPAQKARVKAIVDKAQ